MATPPKPRGAPRLLSTEERKTLSAVTPKSFSAARRLWKKHTGALGTILDAPIGALPDDITDIDDLWDE
jgi:hypothetical protein